MTESRKLEKAEKTLRSLGYVPILWHIDDVRACAEESDLTDDECLDILDTARHRHDALFGLSWGALACHTEEYVAERDR